MTAALRDGFACALFMAVIAACATGGKDNDGQPVDAPRPLDAPVTPIDAPRAIDAFVTPMVDAAPPMVDAAPVVVDAPPGGLFCTANNQCTVAGECCVTLGGPQGFCAPGQVILGQCVPN